MRFIVDNNQISDIRKTTQLARDQKRRITLVLPPLVWAEAVLYHNGKGLSCLADYDLRFGKDIAVVRREFSAIFGNDSEEIDTLIPVGSELHRLGLSWITNAVYSVKLISRANEIKIGRRSAIDRHFLEYGAGENSAAIRSGGMGASIKQKYETLDEAIDDSEFDSPEKMDFLRMLRSECVPIRNFARLHYCTIVARLGMWLDSRANMTGPSGKRDDGPDTTLPLYARAGDAIVTQDKKFSRLFRLADPKEQVRVMAWKDCVTMLNEMARTSG